MAAMQVRALYDFEAATEAELTFKVNDVMLVTRTDVGGGWWEGERDGVLGLFPLHYVQVLDGPVSAPDDGDTSGSEGADSISSKDSLSSGASTTRISTAFSGGRSGSAIDHDDQLVLVDDDGWRPSQRAFSVSVLNPEKRKKFSGVKTYVTYDVRTTLNSDSVSRRYKHFLWLHNRLCERHPFIAVPPIPEKQMQGRFQAAFLEKRRSALERFLNRIARHPILRSSHVFHHFLSTPDYRSWKEGKRTVESEASGLAYLDRIPPPLLPLQDNPQEIVERFGRFCRAMERNIHTAQVMAEHLSGHWEEIDTDYVKTASALRALLASEEDTPSLMDRVIRTAPESAPPIQRGGGCWCWKESCANCLSLSNALGRLSNTFSSASAHHNRNGSAGRLAEALKEIEQIARRFRSITKLHDSAYEGYRLATTKDKDRDPATLATLRGRCDRASAVMLAEMEHFHAARVTELKQALTEYVQQQLTYHQKMAQLWQDLSPEIQNIKEMPSV